MSAEEIMSDFTEPPGGDEPVFCPVCGGEWWPSRVCTCSHSTCEITGDDVDDCDCADCYYERHGEPKPCGQCGGVGGHLFGCN